MVSLGDRGVARGVHVFHGVDSRLSHLRGEGRQFSDSRSHDAVIRVYDDTGGWAYGASVMKKNGTRGGTIDLAPARRRVGNLDVVERKVVALALLPGR